MEKVSIRELRNQGGEIVDRAAAGERITITRGGRPVAELAPVRSPLHAEVLLARWRRLPPIDTEAFRAEVDEIVGERL